ncbi:MAG: T9SS type A sorting domain-containing protein [Lewinellaceae bacterium]|nr:T9SS type A sorting domain-containing protein [Lewinellaceae bacterium]
MVRLLPDAAGSLHSPVFLEPPVDIASLYLPFVHVPNAFDADDDSLVYELAVPMQGVGELVPNYSWPNQIVPNPENQISLDPATGKFTWDAPQAPGHYCIAIVVRAYRNGILVEETRRDLFIEVSELANTPPVLVLIPDISEDEIVEVTVGQIVQIQAIATDPDPGQTLTLTASGDFLKIFSGKSHICSEFQHGYVFWTVKSEHVRTQPHQILFKAKDDFLGDGFAATRIVRFRASEVVGVWGANPDLSGLHIFPNPNAGTFMVELPEPASAGLTFRIVGITGQVLRDQVVQSGITTQTVQADGLPSGLYFLQVVSNGKVLATERFVKQ